MQRGFLDLQQEYPSEMLPLCSWKPCSLLHEWTSLNPQPVLGLGQLAHIWILLPVCWDTWSADHWLPPRLEELCEHIQRSPSCQPMLWSCSRVAHL